MCRLRAATSDSSQILNFWLREVHRFRFQLKIVSAFAALSLERRPMATPRRSPAQRGGRRRHVRWSSRSVDRSSGTFKSRLQVAGSNCKSKLIERGDTGAAHVFQAPPK
eukprot:GHVU01044574.1.p2 GENE.GHVU01044574.1~~GHVU01044574.1.p2  ORF type:complete len:109 (-),score=2.12 GHVU01044574.1:793-1119(-)